MVTSGRPVVLELELRPAPAMLAALKDSVRALAENPPPVAPHRAAEAMAFLEWLAADNFTLLGVRRHAPDGELFTPEDGLGLLRKRLDRQHLA